MKLLWTLLLLCAPFAAHAQSYDYLTFEQTNGDQYSLTVDNLEITFKDGNLVANDGNQTMTLPLTSMRKMFFATEPTAINEAITGTAAAVQVRIEGGAVRLAAPTQAPVSVYSLSGQRMPLTGLSAGVYLVKVGGTTVKVVAQ